MDWGWGSMPSVCGVIEKGKSRGFVKMSTKVRILGASAFYNPDWFVEGYDHWSLNGMHNMVDPDEHELFSAWFQMHSEDQWRGGRNGMDHVAWLKEEHDFPIFMQTTHDDVPASMEYPIERVRKLWPKNLLPGPVLADSFCYMVGLAVVKGYKEIELEGLFMATLIEAYTETFGLGAWLTIAALNGVKITDKTGCFPPFSYGYEPRKPRWWHPQNVAEALIVDELLPARQMRSAWNAERAHRG